MLDGLSLLNYGEGELLVDAMLIAQCSNGAFNMADLREMNFRYYDQIVKESERRTSKQEGQSDG